MDFCSSMGIPEILMIDVGKLLQNPVSTSGSLFWFGQFHRWWKLGALIIAVYAAFRGVIRRSKLFLILCRSFRRRSKQRIGADDDDDASSEDASTSDDEYEADVVENSTTSSRGEDFDVQGSRLSLRENRSRNSDSQLCRGGCKQEFNLGGNIVQLWDSFGLSLDFDDDLLDLDSKSVVSTWDSDEEQNAIEYWSIPGVSSSELVLTAEGNGKGDGVILSGYDSRIRRRLPAFYAEWNSPTNTVTGLSSGGVSKVYVRDNVNGVIGVGDVRKVGRPLKTVRENNVEIWCDTDAVKLNE